MQSLFSSQTSSASRTVPSSEDASAAPLFAATAAPAGAELDSTSEATPLVISSDADRPMTVTMNIQHPKVSRVANGGAWNPARVPD